MREDSTAPGGRPTISHYIRKQPALRVRRPAADERRPVGEGIPRRAADPPARGAPLIDAEPAHQTPIPSPSTGETRSSTGKERRFDLEAGDYTFLRRAMSMLPRECPHPRYDPETWYDSYAKFFLFGDSKAPMPEESLSASPADRASSRLRTSP